MCIKVWGFALLILSHFSKMSYENEIIWVSLRPNYVIFIGYLKTEVGWGGGGAQENPLNPSTSATGFLGLYKQICFTGLAYGIFDSYLELESLI